MSFRVFRSTQLSATLVAACASALNAGQADAGVVYELIQQGSDVVLNVSGSISSAPITTTQQSSFDKLFRSGSNALIAPAAINTPPTSGSRWSLNSGPTNFGTGGITLFSSYSGTNVTFLLGSSLIIDKYTLGSPISGSGLFAGTTLAGLGLSSTTPGLLATWNITGSNNETVEVRIGSLASTSVPGPLPLLGAAAAFAHSRTLKARVRAGSASPQA